MRELILLRHAHAEPATTGQSDLDRPLSPFERSLDVHMSNLRKKLGPCPDGSPRIRTLRSEGYLLACEATH